MNAPLPAAVTVGSPDAEAIRTLAGLPPHDTVHTGKGGTIVLGETERAQLAVIADSSTATCWILHTRSGSRLPFFGELSKRVRSMPFDRRLWLLVDATVIKAINDPSKADVGQVANRSRTDMESVLDDDLAEWVRAGVSDLHIEARQGDPAARFRLRRHGVLLSTEPRPYETAVQLLNAMYNSMADHTTVDSSLDVSKPQKASIERKINGQSVKLRVQTLPAYPGKSFDVIIRIHIDDAKTEPTTLPELGYEESHVAMMERMMMMPSGAIVIAGITGSGKTTTLKAMLDYMSTNRPNKKYISVESPPEYLMPRITQISAKDEDAGFMSDIMSALVRADPDVIMMGEVRNADSGRFLTQMNETGHVMLATVHTDSIFGIPPRLSRLGIDRATMGYSKYFSGLMCQRLVATLCQHCRVPMTEDSKRGEERRKQNEEIANSVKTAAAAAKIKLNAQPQELMYVKGNGCDHCKGIGWSGRTVCAEMTIPDGGMLKRIADGKDNDARERWRSSMNRRADSLEAPDMNGRTMLDHAIIKILRGELSPFDVQDEFGPLDYEAHVAGQLESTFGGGE